MSNRISLEDLKHKPMPNKKQKFGVEAFYSDELVEKKDTKEVQELEEGEEPKEPKRKNIISLVDKRESSKIDRESIMKRLMTKNVFSIKAPLPSVEEDIVESVVSPEEQVNEKPLDQQAPVIKEPDPIVEKKKVKFVAKPSDVSVNLDPEQKAVAIRVKKPRIKVAPGEQIDLNISLETATIQGMPIIKRLPRKNAVVAKVSSYYMNNRKQFIQKLVPMFAEYKKSAEEDKAASCDDRSSSDFETSTHQKVVRDYLNIFSPYRGLLLYHALGSGKTCTSIAIAEGLKSEKPVIVMTPRSLQVNFFNEMKQCGDDMYRRKQFWQFISTEGKADDIPVLAVALSIPVEYIKKNGGAWLIDITKPSNYDKLVDSDKSAIDKQIDEMIKAKYSYINYKGGLNEEKLKLLTDNYKKNPFDNSVILIDEAHNLVSRIVNKIGDKKSISYKLYEYLMSASNSRVILLSGTPIINYPNEIGVLFNILRGYIKTWTFPAVIRERKEEKPTRDNILQWFAREGFNTYDYVDYSGDTLTITRNPFGFINVLKEKAKVSRKTTKKGGSKKHDKKIVTKGVRKTKKNLKEGDSHSLDGPSLDKGLIKVNNPLDQELLPESDPNSIVRMNHIGQNQEFGIYEGGGAFDDYEGVKLDATGNISDTDFVKRVIQILGKNGLDVNKTSVKSKNYKALPDTSKDFFKDFIDVETDSLKNAAVLQRRILGLTSYFRNEQPQLLPKYVPSAMDPIYHIEYSKMSDYQFILYEKIRAEESKKEKNNKKKRAKNAKMGAADGEELFKISSTYRIASRTCCNFAFPDPPGRPVKNNGDYGEDEEPDLDEVEEMRGGGESDDEEEKPKVVKIIRKKTEKKVDDKKGKRKTVKFLEPKEKKDEPEEETKEKEDKPEEAKDEPEEEEEKKDELEEEEEPEEEDKGEDEEKKSDPVEEVTYARRIQNALAELKKRQDEIFSREGLAKYSPKFLNILKNIENTEHEGLHLVYSQFRTLEGIAIFKLVLEANGFAEFKIAKSSTGVWQIVDQEGAEGKPRFVLYTGTESVEEKEIIRNIYNSNWSVAPASIVSKLREQGLENNFMGETIKVFMITASGAEGINLKNTRYVHIMEPYWHMVRLNQVIGRARRLCSHQDLPEELRTVQVFLYIAVIPLDLDPDRIAKDAELKKKKNDHIELVLRDVSRLKPSSGSKETLYDRYVSSLDKSHSVVTTDQMLFENALRKDRITSFILNAAKSTAMDCALYAKENKKENMVCYNFGSVSTNAFSYYPSIDQQIEEKDVAEVTEKTIKLTKVKIGDKEYAVDRGTMKLYDLVEYNEAVKAGEGIDTVTVVGTLKKEGRKYVIE